MVLKKSSRCKKSWSSGACSCYCKQKYFKSAVAANSEKSNVSEGDGGIVLIVLNDEGRAEDSILVKRNIHLPRFIYIWLLLPEESTQSFNQKF